MKVSTLLLIDRWSALLLFTIFSQDSSCFLDDKWITGFTTIFCDEAKKPCIDAQSLKIESSALFVGWSIVLSDKSIRHFGFVWAYVFIIPQEKAEISCQESQVLPQRSVNKNVVATYLDVWSAAKIIMAISFFATSSQTWSSPAFGAKLELQKAPNF